MADAAPVVHIGENSPEEVAYKLLLHVAFCERKALRGPNPPTGDRKWILDTYAECLEAVRGGRSNASTWAVLGRDT